MFKDEQEIIQDIHDIKDALFDFDTQNAEIFCQQISQISDKKQVLDIKKALQTARELYNILRLQGDYRFLSRLDFEKLAILYRETQAGWSWQGVDRQATAAACSTKAWKMCILPLSKLANKNSNLPMT